MRHQKKSNEPAQNTNIQNNTIRSLFITMLSLFFYICTGDHLVTTLFCKDLYVHFNDNISLLFTHSIKYIHITT